MPHSLSTTVNSAVIAGSFGVGNTGDEELLKSFLDVQNRDSHPRQVSIVSKNEMVGHKTCQLPPFYYGWRSYRGTISQSRFIKNIAVENTSDGIFVWMGGLLGEPIHIDLRAQQLGCFAKAGYRPAYFFGDVELAARGARHLKKICEIWAERSGWVGVRSEQAAELLNEANCRVDIHVGVDPVVYRRYEIEKLRFVRQQTPEAALVLCPSSPAILDVKRLKFWTNCVIEAAELGIPIWWCLFDDGDFVAVKVIMAEARKSHPRIEEQEVYTGLAAITRIERASMAIVSRFHALIFASTAGIPTVVEGWNDKLCRFHSLLGLDDWTIDSASENRPLAQWFDATKTWSPCLNRFDDQIASHTVGLNSFLEWQSVTNDH
ncbi:polysaccharide pyruvyl transferase family protein [Novipirellula sp. SH528]|uniref:polysaccharide pyruvyl transferase family protein n=1 Tax=Novipirellula sp. SH528 TaxID=3454466 RepID=UPI003F9FB886